MKSTMKITIKSMILMMLIPLAIYQATVLWSGVLNTDADVLGLGIGHSGESTPFNEKIELLTPNMLGVYLDSDDESGNKVFTVVKRTTLYYDDLFQDSCEALISALQKGEIQTTFGNPTGEDEQDYALKLEQLFNNQSLFFTLHKNLSTDVLMETYDINEKMFEGIHEVTSFGVVLNSSDAYALVYVIDTNNRVNVYTIDDEKTSRTVKNLKFYIDEIQDQGGINTIYASSIFEGLEMLKSHVLLPTDLKTYTKEIYFDTAFVSDSGFDYQGVEDFVNGFEQGSKWFVNHESELLYGNDDTTITYNQDGVFEYKNFSENTDQVLSLAESYSLAKSFIRKDNAIGLQEYYLKNYMQTSNGYIFYYGYSYNDFPLIIDSDYAASLGVIEPMSIEVKGNEVVNYKRVLIAMEEDFVPDVKRYSSDYVEVLMTFLSEEETVKPIDNMFLGYFWDEKESARMRWIIDYNQVYYSRRM